MCCVVSPAAVQNGPRTLLRCAPVDASECWVRARAGLIAVGKAGNRAVSLSCTNGRYSEHRHLR
ncbi:hypothetical protein CSUI_002189, partial [Cystoisospora suis]